MNWNNYIGWPNSQTQPCVRTELQMQFIISDVQLMTKKQKEAEIN